jgi:hypothetical protein
MESILVGVYIREKDILIHIFFLFKLKNITIQIKWILLTFSKTNITYRKEN